MTEIKCPECKSTFWIKNGKYHSRGETFQKYQCRLCYRYFKDEITIEERRELSDKIVGGFTNGN